VHFQHSLTLKGYYFFLYVCAQTVGGGAGNGPTRRNPMNRSATASARSNPKAPADAPKQAGKQVELQV
jgi:hypothetical protein